MHTLTDQLIHYQDIPYGDFTHKLIPNLERDQILGVRIPTLRRFTKTWRQEDYEASLRFVKSLPHKTLEDNHVHAMWLNELKDPETGFPLLEAFLPYLDNWATVDLLHPTFLTKAWPETRHRIPLWLESPLPFVQRFAIGTLLHDGLKTRFEPTFFSWVSRVQSEHYYVNMMIAWFFSMAWVFQEAEMNRVWERLPLSDWCRRKTVQKVVESRQASPQLKSRLRHDIKTRQNKNINSM